MNGKKAKMFRTAAVILAFRKTDDTTQTKAPGVVGNLPAGSYLRDARAGGSGALRIPASCGRFWYRRIKDVEAGRIQPGQLDDGGKALVALLRS